MSYAALRSRDTSKVNLPSSDVEKNPIHEKLQGSLGRTTCSIGRLIYVEVEVKFFGIYSIYCGICKIQKFCQREEREGKISKVI